MPKGIGYGDKPMKPIKPNAGKKPVFMGALMKKKGVKKSK